MLLRLACLRCRCFMRIVSRSALCSLVVAVLRCFPELRLGAQNKRTTTERFVCTLLIIILPAKANIPSYQPRPPYLRVVQNKKIGRTTYVFPQHLDVRRQQGETRSVVNFSAYPRQLRTFVRLSKPRENAGVAYGMRIRHSHFLGQRLRGEACATELQNWIV